MADSVLARVSSTLDKSVGKKYLIDGSPETCWSSQQGLPQYIHLSFASPVVPKLLSLTFQGGFVGTKCSVEIQSPDSSEWRTLTHIYPEDVNRRQTFELPVTDEDADVQALKLVFEESSDFFGRIIVYDLRADGNVR
ncbi:hypothetical protein BV25DRAFT_1911013 [Artomyces pyxidatus]|uniref:Uncharacterized protein n=1 Tax=Artomyces pyxidatus TaxID=48021 RepID=A0ACB8THT9_9AGAM|nr:hypothetical protein BV25DRAFT_1911013 [Artomyces pyxidatus]